MKGNSAAQSSIDVRQTVHVDIARDLKTEVVVQHCDLYRNAFLPTSTAPGLSISRTPEWQCVCRVVGGRRAPPPVTTDFQCTVWWSDEYPTGLPNDLPSQRTRYFN